MMTIKEIQKEITDEFSFFSNWEERYEYLIELGKDLEAFPEEKRTEDRIIKGCQSTVWLDAGMEDGKMKIQADSDGILPKGMVAMLLRVFDGQTPEDILAADMGFIDEIGLNEFLSPNRASGLSSMIKQLKFYALAFRSEAKNTD